MLDASDVTDVSDVSDVIARRRLGAPAVSAKQSDFVDCHGAVSIVDGSRWSVVGGELGQALFECLCGGVGGGEVDCGGLHLGDGVLH